MGTNSILSPIQNDLQQVETLLRESVQVDFAPLSGVFETLIESGGKRIRPALALLATKLHPTDPDQAATLAVAIELVHAATLIHDDLIDKSPVRRGSPTVNSRWSGTATVLAGDYLLARAADIASGIENLRVMRIFARTLMIICDGEIRQDFGGVHWPPNREEYFRHIQSKTASLFKAATETGAVLSGAPEAEIDALAAFGHNLGMAFQIADDILDFTADEQALGKPVGSDLRQGTLTLPVFYFIAQDPRGPRVEALLERSDRDGDEMEDLVQAIRNSPAVVASEQEARRFAQAAIDAIAILPDNIYRRAMTELAQYVVERTL
ncbi:MAG: polyprenyl synthetase family protein [Chloroflexi bacterium]|nr:polyprenyl synthetase family protein [Chloroflexota bacterium]